MAKHEAELRGKLSGIEASRNDPNRYVLGL
jgi:hypothetical protein